MLSLALPEMNILTHPDILPQVARTLIVASRTEFPDRLVAYDEREPLLTKCRTR